MNTTDWTPSTWALSLWNYFRPLIQTGRPIYFSIDSALLRELVLAREPNRNDDPISHLARSCKLLVEVKNRRVYLNSKALEIDENSGLTSVICLIALQVIAVELMADSDRYTDDAYFPKLRELLGMQHDNVLFNDPFYLNHFEKIWNIFKSEILSIPGATPKTITFVRGAGKNIRRGLPISQALLTIQELSDLYAKYIKDGVNARDSSQAFEYLCHQRPMLRDRSRKIISNAKNDEQRGKRLGVQFLDYVKSPILGSAKDAERAISYRGSFVGYPSSDFFESDSVNIYYVDETGSERPELTFTKIVKSCGRDRYLIFIDDGSIYTCKPANQSIKGGDNFIVICPVEKTLVIEETFKRCGNIEETLKVIECKIPEGFVALEARHGTGSPDISIVNGRLTLADAINEKSTITLIGGMLIDGRKNEYLSPYAPKEFFLNGRRLLNDRHIFVNGDEITIGELNQLLRKLSALSEGYYELNIDGARIAFEMCRQKREEQQYPLGYSITDGRIEPTVSVLQDVNNALIGLVFSTTRRWVQGTRRYTKELYAALCIFCDSARKPGIEISSEQIKALNQALVKEKFPEAVIEQAISTLEEERTISPVVWRALFEEGKT